MVLKEGRESLEEVGRMLAFVESHTNKAEERLLCGVCEFGKKMVFV